MRRTVTAITFFIALVVIATGVYAFWLWCCDRLGFVSFFSPREIEVLNRIVFCGYFALFAVLWAARAIVGWLERRMRAFLVSLLVTAGSVVMGVVFYFDAGQLGAGALAIGLPMLLAIVFYFLRPFRR